MLELLSSFTEIVNLFPVLTGTILSTASIYEDGILTVLKIKNLSICGHIALVSTLCLQLGNFVCSLMSFLGILKTKEIGIKRKILFIALQFGFSFFFIVEWNLCFVFSLFILFSSCLLAILFNHQYMVMFSQILWNILWHNGNKSSKGRDNYFLVIENHQLENHTILNWQINENKLCILNTILKKEWFFICFCIFFYLFL